ncbi:MAG: hypothetical protein MJY97_05525 [Bacteroidales bacterium]|nr:hypothetical protein [Bacteroidales bacterium]
MKIIVALTVLVLSAVSAWGQRIGWSLDFQYYFDNREFDLGDEAFTESMTLHAARITPYLTIDLGNSSFRRIGRTASHRLAAGIDLYKDMGSGAKNIDLFDEISFFYEYNKSGRKGRNFSMAAGILPRTLTEGYYSRLIFSDATRFLDHNVEGLLLKYRTRSFFTELWCDWMGQYGYDRRERFQVNTAGKWDLGHVISAGWNASLYHFAGSELEHYVVDNFLANAYLKSDLAYMTDMQVFSIKVGALAGYQRDRREKAFDVPVAFENVTELRKWNLGAENTFVYSPDMMVNYDLLGSDLYFGSPFYHTGTDEFRPYDRLEIYWQPRMGENVHARLSAVCHFADGESSHFTYQGMQQRFSLIVDIRPLNRRPLRNL